MQVGVFKRLNDARLESTTCFNENLTHGARSFILNRVTSPIRTVPIVQPSSNNTSTHKMERGCSLSQECVRG